jgi:hypothetical protein
VKPVTNPNHAAAQSVRIRLAVALEEALHAAGDSCPISHAATLAAGSLAEALRRHDLAVTDTRPPGAGPRRRLRAGPPGRQDRTVTRLEELLDAIDGALDDERVSPDAMRWTPDPEAAAEPGALGAYRTDLEYAPTPWLPTLPEGAVWTRLSNDLPVRGRSVDLIIVDDAAAGAAAAFAAVAEGLAPILRGIGEAFTNAAQTLRPLLERCKEAGLIHDEAPTDLRARALEARRHRNTGPAVPRAQTARRPRHHQ